MVARRGSPDHAGSSQDGPQPNPQAKATRPGDHEGRPYGSMVMADVIS